MARMRNNSKNIKRYYEKKINEGVRLKKSKSVILCRLPGYIDLHIVFEEDNSHELIEKEGDKTRLDAKIV